ncbi:MAG: biopolymer transporter ExbD [Gemmatimonadota bacterium]|nr:biopolymer transporter ExbD [Candidatus Palauibacterales bacterium]
MALLNKKSKVSDEIPTSSMADIAFLLLIFFLVTTVFEDEKGLPIVLPEREAEQVEVSQKNIIHFLIQEDGSVRVRRGESTAEQIVAAGEIEAIMRQEIGQNPEIIAAVKTAPDAPYRFMVSVLDELQQAASQRISLQLWER